MSVERVLRSGVGDRVTISKKRQQLFIEFTFI